MGMGGASTSGGGAGMAGVAAGGDLSGPIPHPMHGGWLGHMLPGWFFLGWAAWWVVGNFRLYLRSSSRSPYTGAALVSHGHAGSLARCLVHIPCNRRISCCTVLLCFRLLAARRSCLLPCR